MVFLEGEGSSTDRKLFSLLFGRNYASVKIIPANGVDNLPRTNSAILTILENNLGSLRFYLVRDRDYLTADQVRAYSERSAGRVRVLERNQIENYLLNDALIAATQSEYFGKPISADRVVELLRRLAAEMAGEVLRDMVSFRLNLAYRAEDFSVGRLLEGERAFVAGTGWDSEKLQLLTVHFERRAADVSNTLSRSTTTESIRELIDAAAREVAGAVDRDDGWRTVFPGKRILAAYAQDQGLGKALPLQNVLLKELSQHEEWIVPELEHIVRVIGKGEDFD